MGEQERVIEALATDRANTDDQTVIKRVTTGRVVYSYWHLFRIHLREFSGYREFKGS
jgi:hypothetical protein